MSNYIQYTHKAQNVSLAPEPNNDETITFFGIMQISTVYGTVNRGLIFIYSQSIQKNQLRFQKKLYPEHCEYQIPN